MIRIWIIGGLTFSLAALCLAQTSQPLLTPEALARRSAEYVELNRKIYPILLGVDPSKFQRLPPEEDAVIDAKLHKMVRETIADVLASPDPTPNNLKTAISALQDQGTSYDDRFTNTPFAETFDSNGSPGVIVAYLVYGPGGAIADTQPVIRFFTKTLEGKWEEKETAGAEFETHRFFVSPINAGLAGEKWYLAWGSQIGTGGGFLTIRLYGFNGNTVRTIWKRDDLQGCEIKILPDSITLDYEEPHSPTERATAIHEALHVTVNGLQ